jgi:polysaccharide biosynthesis transport protein
MNNGNSQPNQESNLHFLDYWRIIRIRKWVILSVFLLVVTTVTIFTLMKSKAYASFVRMEVKKEASNTSPLFGGGGTQFSQHDIYFMQTQFEKIQSKAILYKVIEDLNLNVEWGRRYGNPVAFESLETFQILEKKMKVEQIRNTDIIKITAVSEDPQEAATIANKIADVYRDHRIKDRKDDLEAGLKLQRSKLDADQIEIDQLEQDHTDEVERLDISQTIIGGDGGAMMGTHLETLREVERRRILAESEYMEAAARVTRMESAKGQNLERRILTAVQYDQPLAMLLNDRATAQRELTAKLDEFGESHTSVVRTRGAITELDLQIGQSVAGIMDGLRDIRDLKKQQFDTLTDLAAKEVTKNKKLSADSITLRKLNDKLTQKQELLRVLQLKIAQTEFDNEQLSQKVVTVTDHAEVSIEPVSPNVRLNIIAGVVVGLIAGFGLAFFIEYLDTSVKTIDEVEAAVGAPVLSVIPQNVGSLIDEGLDSPHAEAYRVLRTNIMFQRKDESMNTVTIVSGGAGEGKSTTIFNLAVIFAQNGNRVLLIDSDLRRPSVHKILGVSNNVGLTNVLLGKCKLEDAIQTTGQEGMDALPSGKLPSSAMGILNSPQMKELIQDVKGRYDFVFFDAPPIMGVSDASILASMIDMTLLVIQYRKYPQAMTVRARQSVEKVGGYLLGVVMNNISISQDAYYNYYGGYHYSHYSMDEGQELDSESDQNANGAGKAKPAVEAKLKSEQPRASLNRKY